MKERCVLRLAKALWVGDFCEASSLYCASCLPAAGDELPLWLVWVHVKTLHHGTGKRHEATLYCV